MEIIPYNRTYFRTHFNCGKASLDNYIKNTATKDVKSGACTCFVVLDDTRRIIAYYTLSTDSIPKDDAPDEVKNTIRYPHIPVILLGRLAVHHEFLGNGYGKLLLIDALKRSLKVAKDQIGAVAVIVDPIDLEATKFYKKFGFTPLQGSHRMFMTMRKIEDAFNTAIPG